VQQGVGVAVANQMAVVGNFHTAQAHRPPFGEPMRVVPDSNPSGTRGLVSWYTDERLLREDYSEMASGRQRDRPCIVAFIRLVSRGFLDFGG
jgi:hypothetical protein